MNEDMNNVHLYRYADMDRCSVTLSVSYNFNAVKSKYKGEQASGEADRL